MKIKRWLRCVLTLVVSVMAFSQVGWAAEPILIGVILPNEGLEAKETYNAILLAAGLVNQADGIVFSSKANLGNIYQSSVSADGFGKDFVYRPIKVERISVRKTASGGLHPDDLLHLKKFALERHPTALIIGKSLSGTIPAVAQVAAEAGLSLLNLSITASSVRATLEKDPQKFGHLIHLAPTPAYLSSLLKGALATLKGGGKKRRAYLIHQKGSWQAEMARILTVRLSKGSNLALVGEEEWDPGHSQIHRALARAKERRADLILAVFDAPEDESLLRAWRKQSDPPLLAGVLPTSNWNPGQDSHRKGSYGVLSVAGTLGNFPSGRYGLASRFLKAYRDRFGIAIMTGRAPASAFESVYLLKDAMEAADSTKADLVAAALERVDKSGPLGRLKFDWARQLVFGLDPDKTAVGLASQWSRKGRRMVIYPESLANGTIELPPAK